MYQKLKKKQDTAQTKHYLVEQMRSQDYENSAGLVKKIKNEIDNVKMAQNVVKVANESNA